MSLPSRACRVVAATLAVLLLGTATAAAERHTVQPVKQDRRVATFKLPPLVLSEIRSVYIQTGTRRRKLSLRTVRRAARRGVLRVRVARSSSRRWSARSSVRRQKRVKLVVIIEPAPAPAPEPDPAPEPEPAPAPAPAPAPEPEPTPPASPSPAPITSWRAAGSAPLSDAEAAARVRRNAHEHRPGNYTANRYQPTDGELAAFYAAKDRYGRTRAQYNRHLAFVTGRPSISNPTTDELIQWTAHKWGIPEDLVRAQMVNESNWYMSQLGDTRSGVDASLYPAHSRIDATTVWESLGISQIKWRVAHNGLNEMHPGTEPLRWRSTAFALDYYAATVRYYFDGLCDWCGSAYRAGDGWNSIGTWYSGQWGVNASTYIEHVKQRLADRAWAEPGF